MVVEHLHARAAPPLPGSASAAPPRAPGCPSSSAGGCWTGRPANAGCRHKSRQSGPATGHLRRRMVSPSSSAWVGCSCSPSPALITDASTFCASNSGAPDWSCRTTSRSHCIAFSVPAVSSSVSPLFTDEDDTDMLITSAPRRLPASSNDGPGPRAVLEEQIDQRTASQQIPLRLARAVEQCVALRQIEQTWRSAAGAAPRLPARWRLGRFTLRQPARGPSLRRAPSAASVTSMPGLVVVPVSAARNGCATWPNFRPDRSA